MTEDFKRKSIKIIKKEEKMKNDDNVENLSTVDNAIKVGSVVTLRSGSIPMTVERLIDEGKTIEACWYNPETGIFMENEFRVDALIKYNGKIDSSKF